MSGCPCAQTTMAERVSKGDWLHIFPEGRVSKDGELGRLKWGLGKMLCDVDALVRICLRASLRARLPT